MTYAKFKQELYQFLVNILIKANSLGIADLNKLEMAVQIDNAFNTIPSKYRKDKIGTKFRKFLKGYSYKKKNKMVTVKGVLDYVISKDEQGFIKAWDKGIASFKLTSKWLKSAKESDIQKLYNAVNTKFKDRLKQLMPKFHIQDYASVQKHLDPYIKSQNYTQIHEITDVILKQLNSQEKLTRKNIIAFIQECIDAKILQKSDKLIARDELIIAFKQDSPLIFSYKIIKFIERLYAQDNAYPGTIARFIEHFATKKEVQPASSTPAIEQKEPEITKNYNWVWIAGAAVVFTIIVILLIISNKKKRRR